MTGSERRDKIIATMQENRMPVPGKELASFYNVSRQVIVQDIALMRAAGYDIISTNRGYILNSPKSVKRIFKVQHTDEQMEDELYSIVDLGGCVETVIVIIKYMDGWRRSFILRLGDLRGNFWKI